MALRLAQMTWLHCWPVLRMMRDLLIQVKQLRKRYFIPILSILSGRVCGCLI